MPNQIFTNHYRLQTGSVGEPDCFPLFMQTKFTWARNYCAVPPRSSECGMKTERIGEQKLQKYLKSLGIQPGSVFVALYSQGGSGTPENPARQVSSKYKPSSFLLIKAVQMEGTHKYLRLQLGHLNFLDLQRRFYPHGQHEDRS